MTSAVKEVSLDKQRCRESVWN